MIALKRSLTTPHLVGPWYACQRSTVRDQHLCLAKMRTHGLCDLPRLPGVVKRQLVIAHMVRQQGEK